MSYRQVDRSAEITSHEALIGELRARGLPTYMAMNILEKLITDRDAVAVRGKMHTASPRSDV